VIRVVVTTPGGQGYDLTSQAGGLQWSNLREGGDEQASFTLLRSWVDNHPEVTRGSLVRITDGLDVLWRGRIEDLDRGGEDAETIEVSCFGLGARLEDDLIRVIFIDQDLEAWQQKSAAGKASLYASGFFDVVQDHTVDTDPTEQENAIVLTANGQWAVGVLSEAWYDTGEDTEDACKIAAVVANYEGRALAAGYVGQVTGCDDDLGNGGSSGADLVTSATPTGTVLMIFDEPKRFVSLVLYLSGPSATDGDRSLKFSGVTLYGGTGLAPQGDGPGGYTADQIVGWVVGRVPGVVGRRIDPTSFIFRQAAYDAPTAPQEIIKNANEPEGAVWGTWGPDDIFDRSGEGHFDYRAADADAVWILSRSRADDLDLHDELGALYDRVFVNWQDVSGAEYTEERTATIPVLDAAGISPHTQEIDGGTLTQAAAQQLGDRFFEIQGTDPPARGTAVLSGPVTHTERGELPPHFMRADGANVKIPEALPYSEAISLSRVDRRTVFPIWRVAVDASGEQPRVTIELDQASDRLSMIQARLVSASGGNAAPAGGGAPGAAVSSTIEYGRRKKKRARRRKRPGKQRK
jgi:hypothetical protein